MSSRMLTVKDVSHLLSVSGQLLYQWRSRGIGPPWFKIGPRMVRYPESELREWMSRGRHDPDPGFKPE